MTSVMTDMSHVPLLAPHRIEDTGIRKGLFEDLALKILYLKGEMSLLELTDHMCLSLGIIEELFQFLRKERLCEVKGMTGGTHRNINQIRKQSVQNTLVRPHQLKEAFAELVIDDELLLHLGTAVVSGTSMFMYGPPGTGKSSLAARILRIYKDYVWVPYAVEVDNQIITVFDAGVHQRTTEPPIEDSDRRWVLCRRPFVMTGGELTGDMLELQFNPVSRFYSAPLQMKANNGIFVLDDFGRQRMRPEELLNRWMTALDRRVEFLSLPGGSKFEIPFDTLVVFATNIEPLQLGDEAFLRRIPNKIKVDYATEDQFKEIFRREATDKRSLPVDEETLDFLVNYLTNELQVPLAQCYARDLLDQLFWAARYLHAKPQFTKDLATWACSNYFGQSISKSKPAPTPKR